MSLPKPDGAPIGESRVSSEIIDLAEEWHRDLGLIEDSTSRLGYTPTLWFSRIGVKFPGP